MAKPDNPDAFPVPAENWGLGMTLRDWFAGQALPGLMDRPISHGINTVQPGSELHPRKVAQAAYRYADAMLAERERQP